MVCVSTRPGQLMACERIRPHIVPKKIQSTVDDHGSEDGLPKKDSGPMPLYQTSLLNPKG